MKIDTPTLIHIPALRVLWREAFGDSEAFLDRFFEVAFSPDRCRAVFDCDTPAAALYWFNGAYEGGRVAYLYAIATAKAYRGRGICTALMENTHRHLATLGYTGTVLVPGAPSLFAFYEKMGYSVCGTVHEFCCSAEKEGVPIQKIDEKEYETLRKAFLPRGGIVQGKESIRFLHTEASFYTGDGFLLAAKKEDEHLHGIELLGDSAKAPFILHSLGCTEGCFRAPLGEKPFAMYYPLQDSSAPPPAYLGLAFD